MKIRLGAFALICCSLLNAGKDGQYPKPLVRVADHLQHPVYLTLKHGDGGSKTKLYPDEAALYMREDAAKALARVQAKLKEERGGAWSLASACGYHPASMEATVLGIMAAQTPEKDRGQLMTPENSSRPQGRYWSGLFVNTEELNMGDPATIAAARAQFPPVKHGKKRTKPTYEGGKITPEQKANRDLLMRLMAEAGFSVHPLFYCGFTYDAGEPSEQLEVSFETLAALFAGRTSDKQKYVYMVEGQPQIMSRKEARKAGLAKPLKKKDK